MEKIKYKTTGFVEYGSGCHFWHAQPWLGSHRSVNLNITTFFLTIDAILARDSQLPPNLFLHCDAGDGNWDNPQAVLFAMCVQMDLVSTLIVHRNPVALAVGGQLFPIPRAYFLVVILYAAKVLDMTMTPECVAAGCAHARYRRRVLVYPVSGLQRPPRAPRARLDYTGCTYRVV
jgi:hypothetical protein